MLRPIRLLALPCALGAAAVLGGCTVQPPSGPTVMALPAPGESLGQFQQTDYACRNYAQQQTAYASQGSVGSSPTGTGAALGALGGAALGAAFGAVAGNAGAGTAIGAGTGLLGGAAVGSGRANQSQYSLQQIYNTAYTQCMYSHGNSVRSPPPGYSYGPPPAYAYPYPYPDLAYWGPYPFLSTGGVFFVGGGGGWHHHWH